MAGVVSKNASGNFRIRQIHHVDSFTDTQIHSQARKRVGINGCHAFFRLKEVTASCSAIRVASLRSRRGSS